MDEDDNGILSGSPPVVDRIGEQRLAEVDGLLELLLSEDKSDRARGEQRWALMSEKSGGIVSLTLYVSRGGSSGLDGCFRDRLKVKGGALCEGLLDKCQVGAVLLRRCVQEQWLYLSVEEQEEIRELLLCCYIWLPVRIRGLVLECIRVIAECGGEWKALLSTILYDMTQAYESKVESGMVAALELLYMLSDGSVGNELLDVVQDTLIHLARGMRRFKFTSQRCEITLTSRCRRLCLRIYRCALGRGMYGDRIDQWKEILDGILDELESSPLDLDCIKSALEVLRCYEFNMCSSLIDKVLNILRGYYGYFESMVIKDDKDFGGVIDEDDDGGPTEFIICFVRICGKLLSSAIDDKLLNILCVLSLYSQVPEAQSVIWETDPVLYLEENQNTYSLRGAVGDLVSRSLKVLKGQGVVNSVVEAAAQLIKVSEQKKMSGEKSWWKLLEVALWLIENVIKKNRFIYCLDDHILQNLMSTLGSILTFKTHDLLQARALLTVGLMGKYLQGKHPSDVLTMVRISSERLSQPESKPYLKIAACTAINAFLPLVQTGDKDGLGAILENLLKFITNYMSYDPIVKLGLKTTLSFLRYTPVRTESALIAVRAITELTYNMATTTNDPDIQRLFIALLSLDDFQPIQEHLISVKLLPSQDISSNLIYTNAILKVTPNIDGNLWILCCKIIDRTRDIVHTHNNRLNRAELFESNLDDFLSIKSPKRVASPSLSCSRKSSIGSNKSSMGGYKSSMGGNRSSMGGNKSSIRFCCSNTQIRSIETRCLMNQIAKHCVTVSPTTNEPPPTDCVGFATLTSEPSSEVSTENRSEPLPNSDSREDSRSAKQHAQYRAIRRASSAHSELRSACKSLATSCVLVGKPAENDPYHNCVSMDLRTDARLTDSLLGESGNPMVDEDQLGNYTEGLIWILRKCQDFLQSNQLNVIGSYLIFLLNNKFQIDTASLLQNLLVHYPTELGTPMIKQIFTASCLHGINADTHIVVALARIICIDSRDFVGLLVNSHIVLDEGRFTAFASFVTLMCTCCRNPVLATYDRHVLVLTAIKLLMHESKRLRDLPTAQDVPYLLLKFLITSYFIMNSPPQSSSSDSSVSSSDSDSQQSDASDEQQELWEYDQLNDNLLKSPSTRLSNALLNQLPSQVPEAFESLETNLRDKLQLINKLSNAASFD